MGLHSISDFCAMLQYSFTRVTIVSDGDVYIYNTLHVYTCDVVKHYFYFQIKIKIKNSIPMPSFAELGVEDIASFFVVLLHGSKSNV